MEIKSGFEIDDRLDNENELCITFEKDYGSSECSICKFIDKKMQF